jgi:uncharacterized NAD-dependent epimerase/dehydratase family protein
LRGSEIARPTTSRERRRKANEEGVKAATVTTGSC